MNVSWVPLHCLHSSFCATHFNIEQEQRLCRFRESCVGHSSIEAVIDWSKWQSCIARLYPRSLPVVIDSQAKIQSKPGPHGWCHLSNLTNPVAKAEHTGLLMPTYLQPINIDLIPALEIACRCYSRSISSSSPHPSSHPRYFFPFHSFTLLLFYCFTSVTVLAFDGCKNPVGAMMQRRRVMQRGRTY